MSALAARFAPLLGALGLPVSARADRRIPKEQLLAQMPPADRRTVADGIEALAWLAALKPQTVGIAAAPDGSAPELLVIGVDLRPNAQAERIVERIHKAMPYPLLVIEAGPSGQRASVGRKRPAARGEAGWCWTAPSSAAPSSKWRMASCFRAKAPTARRSAPWPWRPNRMPTLGRVTAAGDGP